MYIYIYIYMFTHICVYIYIYIHTHTYMYVHTVVRGLLGRRLRVLEQRAFLADVEHQVLRQVAEGHELVLDAGDGGRDLLTVIVYHYYYYYY